MTSKSETLKTRQKRQSKPLESDGQRYVRLFDNEKKKLLSLIDSLSEGIVGLDVEGKCIFLNRTAERIFRIDTDASLGKSLLGLIRDKKIREPMRDAIAQSIERGSFAGEFRLRGSLYDIKAIAVENKECVAPSIVIVLENLSQKNELDQKKDEFLALISHELRTPLTVIKGYLDIIAKGMLGELTTEQEECVQIMQGQCNSLETLLTDLIRFGMLARGELTAIPESIKIFPFLERCAQSFKQRLKEARIMLSLVVPDPIITCLCDPDHLKDLLRHLIDNAIKFAGEGSSIQIRADKFDLKDLPPMDERIIKSAPSPYKKWVRINVSDNGRGIPPDKISEIFNSFEQVENYMTRKARGLGLGLALVKKIVEVYEGSLWIKSTVGKGTEVSFLIPHIDRRDI